MTCHLSIRSRAVQMFPIMSLISYINEFIELISEWSSFSIVSTRPSIASLSDDGSGRLKTSLYGMNSTPFFGTIFSQSSTLNDGHQCLRATDTFDLGCILWLFIYSQAGMVNCPDKARRTGRRWVAIKACGQRIPFHLIPSIYRLLWFPCSPTTLFTSVSFPNRCHKCPKRLG